jgi:DNA processing protein
MEDRDYWLALNLVPGVSSTHLYRLVEHFESPEEVLSAPVEELAQVQGLNPKVAEKIKDFDWKAALDKELALIEEHEISIITLDDPAYPENLKTIFDPPLVLYIKGSLEEEDRYSVAIVGSRRGTAYGRLMTEQLASQLVERGLTIVSGMARGIDSAAHRGALAAGGRTIAVLGCGLDIVYPPENHQLMQSITQSGAAISEFPLSTPPNSYNFPVRNRIISGLSLGVVVVEAALRSGTMITVGCALEQGREVFAVPGQVTSKYSQGTHAMIKQGAKLVENIDDILEELHLQLEGLKPTIPAKVEGEATEELSAEEEAVLEVLSYDLIHVDEVIINTDLPANQVLGTLMSLEMKGRVIQAPGKMFCRRD